MYLVKIKDTAKAETFLEKSGDRQALEAAYDDLEEDAAKTLKRQLPQMTTRITKQSAI